MRWPVNRPYTHSALNLISSRAFERSTTKERWWSTPQLCMDKESPVITLQLRNTWDIILLCAHDEFMHVNLHIEQLINQQWWQHSDWWQLCCCVTSLIHFSPAIIAIISCPLRTRLSTAQSDDHCWSAASQPASAIIHHIYAFEEILAHCEHCLAIPLHRAKTLFE